MNRSQSSLSHTQSTQLVTNNEKETTSTSNMDDEYEYEYVNDDGALWSVTLNSYHNARG